MLKKDCKCPYHLTKRVIIGTYLVFIIRIESVPNDEGQPYFADIF